MPFFTNLNKEADCHSALVLMRCPNLVYSAIVQVCSSVNYRFSSMLWALNRNKGHAGIVFCKFRKCSKFLKLKCM